MKQQKYEVPVICKIRSKLFFTRHSPSNVLCPFCLKRIKKCKNCKEIVKYRKKMDEMWEETLKHEKNRTH